MGTRGVLLKGKDSFYAKYIKRVLDIFFCSFAVLALSPIFLFAAIGIKVSSPGKVFYYSDREGKDGKPFHFYKFRSMHNTDNDKHLFIIDEERIFPFGRFIRKSKIDEMPQLLNVLKGDMSIVGPRPMPVGSEMYTGEYEVVKNKKPGLTSPASLYDYTVGDTYTDDKKYKEEVYPVKRKLEKYYVEHISFLYDAQLVIRTMLTIVQKLLGIRQYKEMPELSELDI